MAIYAWHEGGPSAVGLMGLSRALASGFAGPVLGGLADRASRRNILLTTNAARTAIVVAMSASVAGGAGLPAVFVLMAALGLFDPMYESVSGTLLAESVSDSEGLAAANARVGVATNSGFLLGSAGAGLVVAFATTTIALSALAGFFAVSLVPLALIRHGAPTPERQPSVRSGPIVAARDLFGTGGLREAAGFLGLLSMTDGAVDVLAVCAALGYLGAGNAGAGVLQAIIGVGTIVGSMVFAASRRAHHLPAGVVAGSAVLAVSLLAVGSGTGLVAAAAILGVGGLGYAMAEVGSVTLVQRRAADDRRVRVLGLVVSMKAISYAFGAALAGALAARLGARLAFVWTGVAALLLTAGLGMALINVGRRSGDRMTVSTIDA